MSFLYKNKCFSTVLELNSAVAADCSVVSGNMIGVTCTPTASDVSVSGWVAGVNYVSTVVPVQIPCVVPDLQPVSELAWLVVGCWVLAWGLRKVIQQIPGGRG